MLRVNRGEWPKKVFKSEVDVGYEDGETRLDGAKR